MINKIGTIDCDLVETTPVVFGKRLYRFESIRTGEVGYKLNQTGDSYFRFVDIETGLPTTSFAKGHHLGSAHVQDDTVYAYGVPEWGAANINVFWSQDLESWSSQTALDLPGWGIYNNSVCAGDDRYVMAFEIGEPPAEAGVRFTMRFAESTDLLNWKLMPSECIYGKDKYAACPAIRLVGDYYYMIYLGIYYGIDCPQFMPNMVRTRDFISWQDSPFNPVLEFSDEDRQIANQNLTAEQRRLIAGAENINNSDVDLCEFDGRTIINYSWGSQKGTEFLAEAFYEGGLDDFVQSWFSLT